MSNPLGELIGGGEGDYNSYNRGTIKDRSGKNLIVAANQVIDFSEMTIAELRRRQLLSISDPDRVFAVGKYQFTRDTLGDALTKLKVHPSEKFTPELQDRLFIDYELLINRKAIAVYIMDKPGASLYAAQKVASREWASVEDPDTPGHVYWKYEKSGNKMHTTAIQVATALDEMRAEYQAQIGKGLSAEEAWRATASMGPGSFAHVAHANRMSHGQPDPATRQLQETLNTLGYTDAHNRALVADGHDGRHTREAIQAFQRDHGLHVDGIAGPVTLAAVREAVVHIPSIGQPDAPYLRHPQQADALADYRAFAPATVPRFTDVSPTAVTGVEPPSITFPAVSASLDAPAVRHLQENLNTLGMTNHRGLALPVTGDYDTQTRMAVMGFQAEQNLPATGQPDQATIALIQAHATIAQLQQLGAERAVPSREAPSLAPTLPYVPQDTPPVVSQARAITPTGLGHAPNDPRHAGSAEHALYNDLKERFPDASENRLLQFTAACHVNNITAQNLNAVRFDQQGGFVHFAATGDLVAKVASVDVKEPSPQPQQSIQHMQQYDQEQAQMFARIREQNAQINAQAQQGPVLGGC